MRISDWSQTCALPIYAFLMSASLAPRDTPNVEYGSAIYSSVRLTYGRTSARTRPNARGSAEDEAAALVCALPRPLDQAQRNDRIGGGNRRRRPNGDTHGNEQGRERGGTDVWLPVVAA